MSRQVAIAIGVSRVEQARALPLLTGVKSGLDDFCEWASQQGFEVMRHDDADGPVSASDVFETVAAAVDAGDVERLFIFFSGHGLAPGVGDDLWLLSGAGQDPGAAVNV